MISLAIRERKLHDQWDDDLQSESWKSVYGKLLCGDAYSSFIFDHRMEVWYIVNLVLNAITSFTTTVFNTCTIYAMRKTSSLPGPFKTLLLSLAVSDLIAGLLAQPLYILLIVILSKQNTSENSLASTLLLVIVCALCTASLLSVMALSIDRFLAVHLHFRYQELVTHKRVVGAVIVTWISSVGISLVWIWRKAYTAFSFVAIIWSLCFVCMTVVNFRLYQAIKRHRNQIQVSLHVQQVAQHSQVKSATKRRKSAVSTLYVYLVVLVCYLPMYCCIIFTAIHGSADSFLPYSRTVMFFNSSLNPVIYCWRIRPIRQTMMDVLRNIFPCKSVSESVPTRSSQERTSTAPGIHATRNLQES